MEFYQFEGMPQIIWSLTHSMKNGIGDVDYPVCLHDIIFFSRTLEEHEYTPSYLILPREDRPSGALKYAHSARPQ